MNLFLICPRFPYPVLKGDQVIVYNRLKYLSEFHEITLLAFTDKDIKREDYDHIKTFCADVYLVKKSQYTSYISMFFGLFKNCLPIQVNYYESTSFREKIQWILNSKQYDMVHIFLLRLMPYANIIKNVPIVLEAIDSMQLNIERRILMEKGMKRFLLKEELRRLNLFEPYVGNKVDQVVVVSEQDKKNFHTNNVSVVPNGVDFNEFTTSEQKEKRRNTIVFSGNMGYAPNIHAVEWFVKNCFSYIKESNDSVKFFIVGGNVSNRIQRLHDGKNIIVTGYVKSMERFLRNCAVAIAPMQSGSGMQNKVLEAMACNLPVITTTLGLGDIKAINGKEIVIADTPIDFITQVLKCLNSNEYTNEISNNAASFVKKHHSWEKAADKINEIYTNIKLEK